jgi:hypothetical protein
LLRIWDKSPRTTVVTAILQHRHPPYQTPAASTPDTTVPAVLPNYPPKKPPEPTNLPKKLTNKVGFFCYPTPEVAKPRMNEKIGSMTMVVSGVLCTSEKATAFLPYEGHKQIASR